ncbi:interstitial collagenase B-like [Rattus rattus]|uniref:interstitial collagenase B-like n=1 Tax=Rattus rattus TaxID=10117 RepID=UPI0013F2E6E0|nr:interstitial collagenase B-like [Rattus rattus]
MLSLALLLLLLATSSYSLPVSQDGAQQNVETVWKYLENLGEDMQAKNVDAKEVMAEKLRQMQQSFGLKVTGNSNSETPSVIKTPMCGVPDVTPYSITYNNTQWTKTHLTYSILNYTPHLPRKVVEDAIERAFKVWSDVTPLTFERVFEEEGDIVLSFHQGDHGDLYPFNGSKSHFAHAFPPGPGLGGDVHYDLDETWTDNSDNFNLFYVTAHELGHSLGLSHSKDEEALMFPSYTWNNKDFVLNQDDINKIQALYGPSPNPIQPTDATPDPCNSGLTFDAITTYRGEVIFFKDRFYIRVISFLPKPLINVIDLIWPDLPSKIDAAYEASLVDELRFFKGNKVWAVQEQNVLRGFPTDIHSFFGFPSSVTHIDAAVCEEETGKTYFFVDNMYWRYDENTRSMDPGYPRLIAEDFPGIDDKVDDVFQKEDNFYFFHQSTQHIFNLQTRKIVDAPDSSSWFNC